MWNNLPNPHSSLSPLPFTLVRDVRLDLWTYHLLRSLQSNVSLGQLVHCPYYRPFSALDAGFTSPPFLIGTDHYFEWRLLSHHQPLCLITFCISPVFDFPSPKVHFGNSIIHACPTITILYWDCPESLPSNVAEFLFQLGEHLPNNNLYLFKSFLDWFVADFFLPISLTIPPTILFNQLNLPLSPSPLQTPSLYLWCIQNSKLGLTTLTGVQQLYSLWIIFQKKNKALYSYSGIYYYTRQMH